MTIKEMRAATGMTQKAFAEYLRIPLRTVEDWERGAVKCTSYLLDLIRYKLENEGMMISDFDDSAVPYEGGARKTEEEYQIRQDSEG